MKIKNLQIGVALDRELKCFIAAISGKTTKKGDDYIQVTLKDETGETRVNVWNTSAETWDYNLNDIVSLTGSVGEYGGNPQLNISSWSNVEDGKLSDFARQSERDIPEMLKELVSKHISDFETPFIVHVCDNLLKGFFAESFIKAPAARGMHHPWIGGLLEHVLGLCNLADAIYDNHYKIYFPKLDMEKVKFGLIFHDWGKILEYDFSTPNLSYTERGIYQHHIGIVQEYLIRCSVSFENTLGSRSEPDNAPKFEEHRNLLSELSHIIYAHHGQIEWSSLMRPATVEALFVHWLDNFDAQIMNMRESMLKGAKGNIPGWTEKNWALGTQFKWQDVTTNLEGAF